MGNKGRFIVLFGTIRLLDFRRVCTNSHLCKMKYFVELVVTLIPNILCSFFLAPVKKLEPKLDDVTGDLTIEFGKFHLLTRPHPLSPL